MMSNIDHHTIFIVVAVKTHYTIPQVVYDSDVRYPPPPSQSGSAHELISNPNVVTFILNIHYILFG